MRQHPPPITFNKQVCYFRRKCEKDTNFNYSVTIRTLLRVAPFASTNKKYKYKYIILYKFVNTSNIQK